MNKTVYITGLIFLMAAALLPAQISLPGIQGPPAPELSVFLDKESYRPGETALLTVEVLFPEGYHQTHDDVNFNIKGRENRNLIFGSTLYPEGTPDDAGLIQYYDSAALRMEMRISETLTEGILEGTVDLNYQLCDEEGTCYFPSSEELSFTLNISGSPVRQDGSSLWIFLLMALVGGFLLNLMPCVLPLLSVKAMNLIGQSGEKRPVLIRHGLSYTGGILASFWILSLVIVILQNSGRLLGWGFQFQSPLFLALLIGIIYLFALSLFEVFILIPPSSGMNKADQLSRRKGYAGSFFTGVFAVFVATPCTAPFLGSAMGFAFSQSAMVIFLIMTLTGLGLSLPFLLLGFFPEFFKLLPKPGKWMDRFREFMAFLLMGTVVYLSGTLIKQIGEGFSSMLWFLLVLSLAAWIWGWSSRSSRKKVWRRFFRIFPVLMIILSAVFLLDFDTNQSFRISKGDWESFDPEEIKAGLEQPLFLAFSAEWCTSCKVNEKTVLNKEAVRNLFERKGVRKMKADLTVSNPEAMEWIYSFDRAGVPLYLLYLPGEEPRILPEVLNQNLIEEALSGLPDR